MWSRLQKLLEQATFAYDDKGVPRGLAVAHEGLSGETKMFFMSKPTKRLEWVRDMASQSYARKVNFKSCKKIPLAFFCGSGGAGSEGHAAGRAGLRVPSPQSWRPGCGDRRGAGASGPGGAPQKHGGAAVGAAGLRLRRPLAADASEGGHRPDRKP